MKIRGFFALLWASLLAAVAAFAGQPVAELYDKAEYRIAMRDSVALYTAVYTPKAPGEAPVIIFRTPYGCGPYGAGRFPQGFEKGYLRSYVDRGYIIVMQDVRGRYMSEGDFEHVRPAGSGETDETTDSYDTVDWLVRHIPHNNGRVGFAGCSYPGFYAMMGGLCGHPAVKAVSPQAPVTDWFMGDDVHHNGVLMLTDSYRFLSGMNTPPGRVPAAKMPSMSRQAEPDERTFFLEHTTLGAYRAAETQPLLGGDGRASRLRRVVAGTRPAPCLLQCPARGARRRRDVRCRGLLRGVEPLPGPDPAEPFDTVPSGRGPVGARGVA